MPSVIEHEFIKSELSVGKEWISYHNAYKNSQGGYDNAVRIVTKGGKTECDGKKIVISGADEVLLLTGIKWYEKISEGSVQGIERQPVCAATGLSHTSEAPCMLSMLIFSTG